MEKYLFCLMRLCQHNNCQSPVFGTDKKTRIGYCKSHQQYRTDLDKRSIAQKSLSKLKEKVISNKVRSYVKKNQIFYDQETEKRKEIEDWFAMVSKQIEKNPYCWNCGKYIPRTYYRAASAHILPKRKEYGFPSVSTHPVNYLILGAGCGCHSKFDNSWDDASKMKIWPLAIERLKAIYPFIEKGELVRMPDIISSVI